MFVQGNAARIAVIGCNVPRFFTIDVPPGHPEDAMFWKWRGGETKELGDNSALYYHISSVSVVGLNLRGYMANAYIYEHSGVFLKQRIMITACW